MCAFVVYECVSICAEGAVTQSLGQLHKSNVLGARQATTPLELAAAVHFLCGSISFS